MERSSWLVKWVRARLIPSIIDVESTPVMTRMPASMPSGRSCVSRAVMAGKPTIADSSVMVPLSEIVQNESAWRRT